MCREQKPFLLKLFPLENFSLETVSAQKLFTKLGTSIKRSHDVQKLRTITRPIFSDFQGIMPL